MSSTDNRQETALYQLNAGGRGGDRPSEAHRKKMGVDSSRYGRLLDVPSTIQSMAAQRRTGELVLSAGNQQRRIRFSNGLITACTGYRMKLVARSMVWVGVAERPAVEEVYAQLPSGHGPEHLVRALLSARVVRVEQILDALDILVEEEVALVLSWPNAEAQFVDQQQPDAWCDIQQEMGLSLNPSAVLLEALRRQDELATVVEILPNLWDTLSLTSDLPQIDKLSPEARRLIANWSGAMPLGSLVEGWTLPPFRLKMVIAELLRNQLLRTSTAAELVIQAAAMRTSGSLVLAYALLRRAHSLGQNSPRNTLDLAELAAQVGYRNHAAELYLEAAASVGDAAEAERALRQAAALGQDAITPLSQLVTLHLGSGRTEAAANTLLELSLEHERRDENDQAVQCLREAQELGADPLDTGRALSRLFLAQGDEEQAATQLELSARRLHESDRLPEAVELWEQLLKLRPDRLDYARECAEILLWSGEKDACLTLLRSALARNVPASEDLKVSMVELVAKLDPNDVGAHDWLAERYALRRDRQGATAQLRLAAQAQEKSGDDPSLSMTLERILELDRGQVDVLCWLAEVRLRLRQDPVAGELWCEATDLLLERGERRDAKARLENATSILPNFPGLQRRLAEILLRDGDRVGAARRFWSTAELAFGGRDFVTAKEALVELSRLKPDDVLVRVTLMKLAEVAEDSGYESFLVDGIRTAVRTHNLGIALDLAKRRASRHRSIEARCELIELFKRVGDNASELQHGQELVGDLLAQSDLAKAAEILGRLVASNPKNADLVLQLAEVHHTREDVRNAMRCYRHAVVLLQGDNRIEDAKDILDQIADLGDEPEVMAEIRSRLERNIPINWDRVRKELQVGRTSAIQAQQGFTSRINKTAELRGLTPEP